MPTRRSTSPPRSSSGSTAPLPPRASKSVEHRLADLAELVGGRVEGDPDRAVEAVRTLEAAGPRDLSFLNHPRYREQALASQAGALLVSSSLVSQDLPRPLLVVDDPAYALALLLDRLHAPEAPEPGIHPTAVIDPGVEIDPTAHVGPYAVIGSGTRIGACAAIHAHVVIGR